MTTARRHAIRVARSEFRAAPPSDDLGPLIGLAVCAAMFLAVVVTVTSVLQGFL